MIKLYSYIIPFDSGFAPNPFGKFMTLACCKPVIRRVVGRDFDKKDNIWIVGLSPKSDGNKIVFAMRVTEVVTFEQYYKQKRFEYKKPKFKSKRLSDIAGDNIYEKMRDGGYKQHRSMHSDNWKYDNWSESKYDKCHDLSGEYVLLSEDFYYLGKKNKKHLEEYLADLKVQRFHKCNFTEKTKKNFENYIRNQNKPTVYYTVLKEEILKCKFDC